MSAGHGVTAARGGPGDIPAPLKSRCDSGVSSTLRPGTPGCVHRWLLDSPAGPLSRAECRSCGAVRELPNVYALDRERQVWVGHDAAHQRKHRRVER
jgi:hypothetical protein